MADKKNEFKHKSCSPKAVYNVAIQQRPFRRSLIVQKEFQKNQKMVL